MTINITPNDYKEVTECREEVVQYICDAFLYGCIWSQFHPNSDGCYRPRTDYVLIRNNKGYGFWGDGSDADKSIEIRKCEVELAIKLLLENGYYLYRSYGTYTSYTISKSPRRTDATRVSEIYANDWNGYFL